MRLTPHDVVTDMVIELHARRARSALMMCAVALSVGSLLGAVGFSQSAAREVDAALAASSVDLVRVVASSPAGTRSVHAVLPPDADERAGRLDKVTSAGRRIDVSDVLTTTVVRTGVDGLRAPDAVVTGLSAGYLGAVHGERALPTAAWTLDTSERVALVGAAVAEALHLPAVSATGGSTVSVNGVAYQVVGVLGATSPDLSDAVAVPYAVGVALAGDDSTSEMLVRTDIGAGPAVSRAVTTALRPDAPEKLAASPVINQADLRDGVSTQLARLAAWVGGLLLALSILLIANSMTVSVMARVREIGLRRAIGYTRADVAVLFLAEGGTVGLLGGLTGAAVGTAAVVTVAAANQWTAVLGPVWVLGAPVVGALAGLLSSLYPALRAARVHPALAVRSD